MSVPGHAARHERATLPDVDFSGWFGVRCIFKLDGDEQVGYEERVTVWRAEGPDEAIALAEAEAEEYVEGLDAEYLGLAQVYTMADELGAGAEVFSLTRFSSLEPSQYLDTFFDAGSERQTHGPATESD